MKDLPYGKRKQKRQEASSPILDAFWSLVPETSALKTTNEKLTESLIYSTNQKAGLETFLEYVRLPCRITYMRPISSPMQQQDGPDSLPILREELGQMRSCIR